MDLQTLLANGIGIIGGLASLGATFDKILTTDETRAKISIFLQRSKTASKQTIFAYISLVNETVFTRYFSAPFFSWRYFFTCAIVSLVSLIVIVVAQLIGHGTAAVEKLTLDVPQSMLLLACLAVNLIIDWISIGQTQIFFEISERQTRLSRAVVLIISDFILTINVFTLLYAQPIGLALYLYGAIAQDVKISATVQVEEIKADDFWRTIEPASPTFPKDSPLFKIRFGMELESSGGEENARGGTVLAEANTPNLSLANLLHLAEGRISHSVKASQQFFLIKRESKPEERQGVPKRFSDDWNKLIEDPDAEEKEEVELEFPAFSDPKSRMLAYSIAYRNVDEVQDGFPAVLLVPMNFLSVDDLNLQYHALLLENASKLRGCGTSLNGQMQWELKADISACEGRVEFSPNGLVSLRRRAQEANSVLSGTQVPLNSFFMTSLSVTVLLYAAAFFLLLARGLYQRVILGISSMEQIFLKSPLAIVGFLLGFLVFATTLIV